MLLRPFEVVEQREVLMENPFQAPPEVFNYVEIW